MICDRCGVVNRPGRISCVQCLGPLTNAQGEAAVGHCKEHPDVPATGKCVTCGTLVCDACGGVVGNRGVFCIEHTPAITSATGASPGMNPLLGGGGGAMPVARKQSNGGMIAAIAAALGLIVLFVVLFLWPGILRSAELPAPPASAGGMGAPGSPYGAPGGPAGPYGPPGGPAGPYGPPGGPGGYGPPGGPGGYGPPGGPGGYGPPGGPAGNAAPQGA
jgi:hypothetical protein